MLWNFEIVVLFLGRVRKINCPKSNQVMKNRGNSDWLVWVNLAILVILAILTNKVILVIILNKLILIDLLDLLIMMNLLILVILVVLRYLRILKLL